MNKVLNLIIATVACWGCLQVDTEAARFYPLSPSFDISANCESTLNIMLDTQGVDSPAGDAVILFDPAQVEIVDQNSAASGIQVRSGNGYEFYPGNKVDEANGKIYLSGISIMTTLNGNVNHGAVIFKAKPGNSQVDFAFQYAPGNTLDSNVANTVGDDILTSVSNATFTINNNSYCGQDTTPPRIENLNPSNNSKGVALDSTLSFSVTDNQSGVDIGGVRVTIDGINYKNDDQEFAYTGDPSRYNIEITPRELLTDGAQIYVNIDAADRAGNTMNLFKASFNAPTVPVQSVCGDGKIEGDEQCELPNQGTCSADCRSLVCEVVDNIEPSCGNNVVEQGEQCEPPGTPGCTMECRLTTIEQTILATEEETQEASRFLGMIRSDDGEKTTRYNNIQNIKTIKKSDLPTFQLMALDQDADGLPDEMERKYKTKADVADTDNDGVSDLDEILKFATDPLVAETNFDFTKILNYKNGDTVGTANLLVRGVSLIDTTVKVTAISESGVKFAVGESITDEEKSFLIKSTTPLDEGKYELVAEAYDANQQLVSNSDSVWITIDFNKLIPAPVIDGINDESVLEGIKVKLAGDGNNQPYVIGRTAPGTQVVAMFQSVILTSTIIADTQTGFFTIFAPRPMDFGEHEVTVYAIGAEGLVSDYNTVEFEILEPTPLVESGKFWIYLLLAIVILGSGAGIYYYRRRLSS